jgi:hypothetical protein
MVKLPENPPQRRRRMVKLPENPPQRRKKFRKQNGVVSSTLLLGVLGGSE